MYERIRTHKNLISGPRVSAIRRRGGYHSDLMISLRASRFGDSPTWWFPRRLDDGIENYDLGVSRVHGIHD